MILLHTSDILLGADFSHCHAVADRARAARMEVLRTLLALAKREDAAAIVIAGNLWADNRVGQALIDEAASLLSKSAVPLYLLPGHRDPMTPDSPYELYPDRFQGKVRVLGTDEPVLIKGGLTLLPYPVKHRRAAGDPTRSLPERDREPLRIAVVNTSPEGYRLGPGGLSKRELDYICAGGEVERKSEGDVHWSGTPEPTDFAQNCGTATIVNLAPGRPAQHRPVPVASLDWLDESETISNSEQLKDLTRRWGQHEQRATTLLRLTLHGQLDVAGLAEVEATRRTLAARLLHLELRNGIAPSLDGVAYRHPLLKAVAGRLAEMASQPFAPAALASEPEIAREALAMLIKTLETSPHADTV